MIFGSVINENLTDEIIVTVIATGFASQGEIFSPKSGEKPNWHEYEKTDSLKDEMSHHDQNFFDDAGQNDSYSNGRLRTYWEQNNDFNQKEAVLPSDREIKDKVKTRRERIPAQEADFEQPEKYLDIPAFFRRRKKRTRSTR